MNMEIVSRAWHNFYFRLKCSERGMYRVYIFPNYIYIYMMAYLHSCFMHCFIKKTITQTGCLQHIIYTIYILGQEL